MSRVEHHKTTRQERGQIKREVPGIAGCSEDWQGAGQHIGVALERKLASATSVENERRYLINKY